MNQSGAKLLQMTFGKGMGGSDEPFVSEDVTLPYGVDVGTTTSGVMQQERYCGPISLLIGIFFFPWICFCPVDTRPATIRE